MEEPLLRQKVNTDYAEMAVELYQPYTHKKLIPFIIERHLKVSSDDSEIFFDKLMKALVNDPFYQACTYGDVSEKTIVRSFESSIKYQNPFAKENEILLIASANHEIDLIEIANKLIEVKNTEWSKENDLKWSALQKMCKKRKIQIEFGPQSLPFLSQYTVTFVAQKRSVMEAGAPIATVSTIGDNRAAWRIIYRIVLVLEYFKKNATSADYFPDIAANVNKNDIELGDGCESPEINVSKPNTIIVKSNFDIYFPEIDMILELSAIRKALYIFFLKRSEGVVLKQLSEHKDELKQIYVKIRPGVEAADKPINNLFDLKSPTLNANLSEINKAIKILLKNTDSAPYLISGEKTKAYSVKIPRDLVTFEL